MKHSAAEAKRIREAFEKALPHLLRDMEHLYIKDGVLHRRLFTAFKRGYNTAMNDQLRGSR